MAIAPCLFGFKCPHNGIGEDGENLCLHPYKNTDNIPEDELFGFVEDSDCPNMELGSEIEIILLAYFESSEIEKAIKEYHNKSMSEIDNCIKRS